MISAQPPGRSSACSCLLAKRQSWPCPRHRSSAPRSLRRDSSQASRQSPSTARPPEHFAHTKHRVQPPKSIEDLSSCDSPSPCSERASRVSGSYYIRIKTKKGPESIRAFPISGSCKQRSTARYLVPGRRRDHRACGDGGGDCCCWPEDGPRQPVDRPGPAHLQRG